MARISGVNIPLNKRVEIGLTYIYGIGRSTANHLLAEVGIEPDRKVRDLTVAPHDLGEALTLADRIILFSARPGRIKDMFEVDFPRPRDAVKVRETPRYAELFQHIWHSLGEEFVRGRRQ